MPPRPAGAMTSSSRRHRSRRPRALAGQCVGDVSSAHVPCARPKRTSFVASSRPPHSAHTTAVGRPHVIRSRPPHIPHDSDAARPPQCPALSAHPRARPPPSSGAYVPPTRRHTRRARAWHAHLSRSQHTSLASDSLPCGFRPFRVQLQGKFRPCCRAAYRKGKSRDQSGLVWWRPGIHDPSQ